MAGLRPNIPRGCRQAQPERATIASGPLAAAGHCFHSELRELIDGTPAQPFLRPDNARMFGSIRSVAVSAIAALEHVQAQRATPFAVREWVRAGRAPGALFVTYKAAQIAALRSMIATWMRLAIFEAMNGRENVDQRSWFVVDELDALGAIEGLKDALARRENSAAGVCWDFNP